MEPNEKEVLFLRENFRLEKEDAEALRAFLEQRGFTRSPIALLFLAAYIGGELGLQTTIPADVEAGYLAMIHGTIDSTREMFRDYASKRPPA
jgi:hypothetical protein